MGELIPYRCGAWAKPNASVSIYRGMLGISGIELDTLDQVYSLEDKTEYLDMLELFWKFEQQLKLRHPALPFPPAADASLPPNCRVPMAKPNEMLSACGCTVFGQLFQTVSAEIPGFSHFIHEVYNKLAASEL